MQEVSKKSVNGGSQVSGGFIFDQMDRFAHDYIKDMFNVKGFLFTKNANVVFVQQICDWEKVKLFVSLADKEMDHNYCVIVNAIIDGVKMAFAKIQFVEKDHAYCDTKGE